MDAIADLAPPAPGEDPPGGPEAPALSFDGRTLTYGDLAVSTWKAGNYLRHVGVHADATVAIDDPYAAGDGAHAPESIFAFLGAGLHEATVRFDPPSAPDATALIVPADRLDAYDPPAGCTPTVHGGDLSDPDVADFDHGVWSENPTFPPVDPDPGAAVLTDGEERFAQRRLFAAAGRVIDERGLDADATVALRAPFSAPGAVVAGLIAPLSIGATVALPDADADPDLTVGGDGLDPASVRASL